MSDQPQNPPLIGFGKIIAGAAIAILLLAFLTKHPFLNEYCFGDVWTSDLCVHPVVYYTLFAAAIALVGAGLLPLLRQRNGRPQAGPGG